MLKNIYRILAAAVLFAALTGCAAFRSELHGVYPGTVQRNPDSRPVNTFFIFTHVEQTIGYDAVPKIVGKNSSVSGFDEIFAEALRELSNVGTYATFNEEASDVNQPERRARKDSLKNKADYTVKVRLVMEKRFANYFLGSLVSTVSLTAVPVPYVRHFRMETEIIAQDGKLVGSYRRSASVSNWVETLLIVMYPFHPANRKIEETYLGMLTDTFRQIESEGVLQALAPRPAS